LGLAHGCLLQVPGEARRPLNVSGLRAFVATGKQNDYRAAAHGEVTRAIIDSQFRDAFTNCFYISWIPSGQSLNTSQNARPCTNVAQAIKSLGVRIGFANFNHKDIVAEWLRFVNAFHLGGVKGSNVGCPEVQYILPNPAPPEKLRYG
jgi:hypothetical protein